MNISVTTVIIIVITVLVISVLGFFLTSSASKEINRGDYAKIFASRCAEYKDQECSWNVTRQAGFEDFVNACKQLYGDDREAFSCLYNYCNQCKRTTTSQQMLCYTLCNEARSNRAIGIDHRAACSQFSEDCSGSGIYCDDACGG